MTNAEFILMEREIFQKLIEKTHLPIVVIVGIVSKRLRELFQQGTFEFSKLFEEAAETIRESMVWGGVLYALTTKSRISIRLGIKAYFNSFAEEMVTQQYCKIYSGLKQLKYEEIAEYIRDVCAGLDITVSQCYVFSDADFLLPAVQVLSV